MPDYIDSWSTRSGNKLLVEILKCMVPQWKDGPREWQAGCEGNIMDGRDVLAITATGDGKTALNTGTHLSQITNPLRKILSALLYRR
ncbi:hypothetical protein BOTBODRAFT_59122 [Botryobasidium botryosum FD-172 SS1]|uniref:Uncharacterized protein n=1 Tax=Botryobasidium botryosum (strain FD-172 SS1) TaxID=930990 RepID=A0A067MAX5_BOTB1|nr:hypothetical protein BOTBODRAFT_59122 [Botryobasidium botryosum FD-172 SS1]